MAIVKTMENTEVEILDKNINQLKVGDVLYLLKYNGYTTKPLIMEVEISKIDILNGEYIVGFGLELWKRGIPLKSVKFLKKSKRSIPVPHVVVNTNYQDDNVFCTSMYEVEKLLTEKIKSEIAKYKGIVNFLEKELKDPFFRAEYIDTLSRK